MFINTFPLLHPQPIKPPPVAFIPFLSTGLTSPHQTVALESKSERIFIGNVDSNVFMEMGRPLYSFAFSIFAIRNGRKILVGSHKIVQTFEELERLHQQLSKCISDSTSLPQFPSTQWLSYSVRLEVLKQRKSFLQEYFTILMSSPSFLGCHPAHRYLNIPSRLSQHLVSLVN